ncbi:DUF4198 domain-containing protein [Campylobacter sp.]|uniref:DUF4198 domain-containing protein n=1 Tax=Campylobacter sp. TaxID=205 RepID=UPI002702322E|nr:DUF4198 domain-containing protein [Campylobacter sp.]
MRKILTSLVVAGVLSGVLAHDFWVIGSNGDKFGADIGYGHGFPAPEPISPERAKLFDPLYVLKKDGSKMVLKQAKESYHFEGDKLEAGSYVLAGDYKPTFWSKDKEGKWHMGGTKDKVANAESCQLAAMSAKSVVNVGEIQDEFISKPIGQKIEIVPLENPSNFIVEKPFKVQVFVDGKPLKRARVLGTYDKFLPNQYAFSGTANLEGVAEVMALKAGKWMLKVTHEQPYSDTKICDREVLVATFTFDVK